MVAGRPGVVQALGFEVGVGCLPEEAFRGDVWGVDVAAAEAESGAAGSGWSVQLTATLVWGWADELPVAGVVNCGLREAALELGEGERTDVMQRAQNDECGGAGHAYTLTHEVRCVFRKLCQSICVRLGAG